ncbi:radical SAM family heme chaperone HemW [Texcoconibacillus texcoconensis]|uniref:Heme chaperone HemW n=1 Tax=Texcoconibacillus texcoconensis TaxID=1095777 RepID=A0A840QRG0_9BACI|nr:radical SAM family heme chaperone HemW [Texcoconibacillus texcoconensis]MBB5173954.1 oxygen-independent coproporphyrinogen-3 oxidase [Texcoconibacillus texcoconensis]
MIQAVYVHVPFCEQICHYCDFNKFYYQYQPVDEYLQCCDQEMKRVTSLYPPEEIRSIYVGGGTPTALKSTELDKLLSSIAHHFPKRASDIEYTVEINPGNVGVEELKQLKQRGVNRLSIGAQTFNEQLLKKIGRDHAPGDVERTIKAARKVGFNNISIDLMYALPGQTLEGFRDTLAEAFRLDVDHVSSYALKIEAKTVFYQRWKQGVLPLPSEETEAEMFQVLIEEMEKNGYSQYEISNFAKRGYESVHNLTYWNNEGYYGVGAGAHSYMGGVRRENLGPLPKYMTSIKEGELPIREEHHVSKREMMEEEMFMGLRKKAGVSKSMFREKYDIELRKVFADALDYLTEKGFIKETDEAVSLTEEGIYFGNDVFEQFLLGEE